MSTDEIERGDFVTFKHLLRHNGHTAVGCGSGYVVQEDEEHFVIQFGDNQHRVPKSHCFMQAKQFRLEV